MAGTRKNRMKIDPEYCFKSNISYILELNLFVFKWYTPVLRKVDMYNRFIIPEG